MQKVLLDTSVIIDFLRVKDKQPTILFSLANKRIKLYISMITQAELYSGKHIWKVKLAMNEMEVLLGGLYVLPFDQKLTKSAGGLRAEYDIDLLDAIIAATAISAKLPLVTLNIKDFQKIKGLKVLEQ